MSEHYDVRAIGYFGLAWLFIAGLPYFCILEFCRPLSACRPPPGLPIHLSPRLSVYLVIHCRFWFHCLHILFSVGLFDIIFIAGFVIRSVMYPFVIFVYFGFVELVSSPFRLVTTGLIYCSAYLPSSLRQRRSTAQQHVLFLVAEREERF
jgi:hypothetical protein